jgi:AcrR family transcriptional regulator
MNDQRDPTRLAPEDKSARLSRSDGSSKSSRSAGAREGRGAPTRERLVDAAMELFASQGYRGTTVGEIEEKAGMAPRSGALYQHFTSKEDVLRAGLQRHIDDLTEVGSAIDLLPLGDLRSELILMGRWTLNDLTKREPLQRFVRKEGERFPELLDQVRESVHDEPHRRLAEWIRRSAAEAGAPEPDAEVLALIIAGSMGHFRMLESLYGEKPLGIDDERFLQTWVDVCLAIAAGYGLPVDDQGHAKD